VLNKKVGPIFKESYCRTIYQIKCQKALKNMVFGSGIRIRNTNI